MIRIKTILFPTDFSRCAAQALTHALHLSQVFGAELHLLHAVVLHEDDPNNPSHHFPERDELERRLRETTAGELQGAREDGTVRIREALVRGLSAAPAIVDYAREQDVDLVVMGTHGRRGLQHLFLGSVAEEVIRTAPCPVMTIRERKTAVSAVEAVERIVVPVDFSPYARQALLYAGQLAETYQARLHLLHVVEESMHPAFYNTGVTSIYDLVPDIEPRARGELGRFAEEVLGPGVVPELTVQRGRAARDIIRFAERSDADLIVIATHGLTGIEHLFLGSVTEKVVRRAPCPVFTVKAFGKSLVEG